MRKFHARLDTAEEERKREVDQLRSQKEWKENFDNYEEGFDIDWKRRMKGKKPVMAYRSRTTQKLGDVFDFDSLKEEL